MTTPKHITAIEDLSEEWRPVPNYPGYYEVSDTGRVRSVNRSARNSLGRVYSYQGKILTPTVTENGYHKVFLSKEGTVKGFFVHVLVAHAFIKEKPNGTVTDHIDHNKINNTPSNLQYISLRKNTVKYYLRARGVDVGVNIMPNGTFTATATINDKRKSLGTYKTKQEAIAAFSGAQIAFESANARPAIKAMYEENERLRGESIGNGLEGVLRAVELSRINGRDLEKWINEIEHRAKQALEDKSDG